jgi:hypothetical protein
MPQHPSHPKFVLAIKLAAACGLCIAAVLLVVWLTGL